ncbi:MAG: AzlD domain-containing protein [Treponema sp.]|jgi:branched-subunit amino acid transport protein AzlD|nr:AzlD domain-containing protein [Treponema sp.]
MLTIPQALVLTFVMGAVIFFCRAFPFLFFRNTGGEASDLWSANQGSVDHEKKSRRAALINFVEKVVPPVAMTVLAFNALAGPLKTDIKEGFPALIAAVITALLHLWRRNPLISIFGGTAVYMILQKQFVIWINH